jgi:hypothetical protein
MTNQVLKSNPIIMFQNIDFARILTLALLLTATTATTSLTTNNCPPTYDLAAANSTTDTSA